MTSQLEKINRIINNIPLMQVLDVAEKLAKYSRIPGLLLIIKIIKVLLKMKKH